MGFCLARTGMRMILAFSCHLNSKYFFFALVSKQNILFCGHLKCRHLENVIVVYFDLIQ